MRVAAYAPDIRAGGGRPAPAPGRGRVHPVHILGPRSAPEAAGLSVLCMGCTRSAGRQRPSGRDVGFVSGVHADEGCRGPEARRCAPRARRRRNRAPGAQDRRVGPVDAGPPRHRAARRAPCRPGSRGGTGRPRIENDRLVPLASSGPIETAIDFAIARRFTGRSTRSFRRGASPLLHVRPLRLDGTWNHSWSRRVAAARRPRPVAAEASTAEGMVPRRHRSCTARAAAERLAGLAGRTAAW